MAPGSLRARTLCLRRTRRILFRHRAGYCPWPLSLHYVSYSRHARWLVVDSGLLFFSPVARRRSAFATHLLGLGGNVCVERAHQRINWFRLPRRGNWALLDSHRQSSPLAAAPSCFELIDFPGDRGALARVGGVAQS